MKDAIISKEDFITYLYNYKLDDEWYELYVRYIQDMDSSYKEKLDIIYQSFIETSDKCLDIEERGRVFLDTYIYMKNVEHRLTYAESQTAINEGWKKYAFMQSYTNKDDKNITHEETVLKEKYPDYLIKTNNDTYKENNNLETVSTSDNTTKKYKVGDSVIISDNEGIVSSVDYEKEVITVKCFDGVIRKTSPKVSEAILKKIIEEPKVELTKENKQEVLSDSLPKEVNKEKLHQIIKASKDTPIDSLKEIESASSEIKAVTTLSFSIKTSRSELCYYEYCNNEKLGLEVTVENNTETPFGFYSVIVKTTSDILIGIDAWNIKGFLGAVGSGKARIIEKQSFSINPVLFNDLSERNKEIISATFLNDSGEVVMSSECTVVIETKDYWNGSIQALPFFIERNNPDIIRIQGKISQAMQSISGSNELDAYQSHNVNRVLQQCASIYSVLQSQKLIYLEPKQGEELKGQRIRSVSEVLDSKAATCLDSTLLFCAVAESIGLHPLVCVTEGHAFPGVWLDEQSIFNSLVHDNPTEIIVKSEDFNPKICILESTLITAVPSVSFEIACRIAREKAYKSNNLITLDVRFARKCGMSPMPNKIISKAGEVDFEENVVDSYSKNKPSKVVEVKVDEKDVSDNTPKTRMQSWERSLLSFSARSPLLNEKVRSTSILLLHPQLEELENNLEEGKRFSLVANPLEEEFDLKNDLDIRKHSEILLKFTNDKKLCTGEDEKSLERKLKQIGRRAQNELSETGVNPLFLAVGHIEWTDDSSSYCAPILLYPVSLIKKSKKEYLLALRDGEEPQLNYSIFETISSKYGIKTSLDYEKLPRDDKGLDVRVILQKIKKDIECEPSWRVGESVLLGIFSFDQFVLWNDIHKHSNFLLDNKIVYGLAKNELVESKDLPSVTDKDFLDETIPVSCDESQMRAVKAAGAGNSFILQGPPGTGKSQTITAMIVDALAKGKKVLFVAEKMAALQVVYRNLCKVKCNDFLLEMHSTKLTKSHLIEQLEKAKNRQSYINQTFQQEEYIKTIDYVLNEYVEALHSKNGCGLSLCQLINMYEEVKGQEDGLMFYGDIENISINQLKNTYLDLVELSRSIAKFQPIDKSVFRFFHYTDISDEDFSKVSKELYHLNDSIESVQNELSDVSKTIGISFENSLNISVLNDIKNIADISEQVGKEKMPEEFLYYCNQDIEEIVSTVNRYIKAKSDFEKILGKTWSLSILNLDIPKMIREWDTIKEGFFKKNKRKEFVSKISSYSTVSIPESEIEVKLRQLNSISIEVEKLTSVFEEIPYEIQDIVKRKSEKLITKLRFVQDTRNKLKSILYSIYKTAPTEDEISSVLKNCKNKVQELRECYRNTIRFITSWESLKSILQADEELWSCSFTEVRNFINEWSKNINNFLSWGRCNSSIKKISENKYAKRYLDRTLSGESPDSFQNQMKASYLRTQIESIILKYPVLERYDSSGFLSIIDQLEKLEKEYQEFVVDDLSTRITRIISRRNKDYCQEKVLDFFIRSKGKKRSIRSLFNECGETITNLCPCLLMSPMSVSQFFTPDKQVFDIVIMDEASQIQTCKAIGAISRGKELIVVGDSKQMPPTSFFNKNLDDEEEYSFEKESITDLDSILEDCARVGLPKLELSWHYRSKSESLIHFSNSHYYSGKLKTYPSVDAMVSKIRLKKVIGYYQSDSKEPNPAEAEAIIGEIIKRLKDPVLSKDSIGVITFNEKQQSHIIRELDKRFEKEPSLAKIAHWEENEIDCPNKLIVKNLENIQGDERDVIMLSVTFGRTKTGRFLKNFGPIGKEGGEKRLNVAFSRAKKEMLVFTIIDVPEFANEELNSRGARDLRDFLKYASYFSIEDNTSINKMEVCNEIASILTERGYQPSVYVGLSDFKVDIALKNPKNNKEFFCAILFDGENINTATLTNDRFVLRRQMLIDRGWKVIQVRLVDWFSNTNLFMISLIEKIENALSQLKKEEEDKKLIQNEPALLENSDVVETSYAGEYIECELPFDEMTPNQFLISEKDLIVNRLKQVIEVEGPIIDDLLQLRVVNSYGIKRRGKNIRERLDCILNGLDTVFSTQTDTTGSVHKVYWPEYYRDKIDQIDSQYISFRNPPSGDSSKKRQIGEYPQIEIRNAIASYIKTAGPTVKETLLSETINRLGFKRTGNGIVDTLDIVLKNNLENGFFIRNEQSGRIDLNGDQ